MQPFEDELPDPKAATAMLSVLYSLDGALPPFTTRHPLGGEVLELAETPRIAVARRGKRLDRILTSFGSYSRG